jgi:transposase
LVRALVGELQQELAELDRRITTYNRRIRELYRGSKLCRRLGQIEGIGPLSATALVAAVGDRQGFKNGRRFAAWLGLVPKQRSSGGRDRLWPPGELTFSRRTGTRTGPRFGAGSQRQSKNSSE